MLLRPGSAGDGGAEEPEEHEQLSAGTAGRGRDVDGLGARVWVGRHASSVGEVFGSTHGICITTTRYGNEGHTHALHK